MLLANANGKVAMISAASSKRLNVRYNSKKMINPDHGYVAQTDLCSALGQYRQLPQLSEGLQCRY